VANFTQSYGQAWGWSDTACNQLFAFMCRADTPGQYSFTSRMGNVYTLDTQPATQVDAQALCVQQGGHLVSYK
jgi:hypothetical protein